MSHQLPGINFRTFKEKQRFVSIQVQRKTFDIDMFASFFFKPEIIIEGRKLHNIGKRALFLH